MPISDQVMRDLREVVQATRADGDVAAMNAAERLVFRVLPELLDEVERLRSERDSTLPKDFPGPVERVPRDPYPINPAHTVRVLGVDGVTRVECDHTFKGSTNCVHCDMPISELKRRARLEAEALASTDVRRAVAEHPALPEADVVSIVLGPMLRQRVDTIVQTNRLGTRLDLVVQTMFILGLLDCEGMDPRAYIGEPKQHFSHDATFIRFALPHEGTEQRREVMQSVFAWLHAWLGDDDELQRAAGAALAALPR